MKKIITGALLAGSIAAAGLAPGGAQADPFSPQPHSWCPGQGLPYHGIGWDMGVCHTWYIVPMGQGNVRLGGTTNDSFVLADVPAPVYDPPPPSPQPPHPFCTPRGGLIIIPPICDEIGVHG